MTQKEEREFKQKRKVPQQKTVKVPKKTYKKVRAIRYRQEMVEQDSMRWEVKEVKRTIWETEVKQVKVVAAPQTRVDCCGNHVPIV